MKNKDIDNNKELERLITEGQKRWEEADKIDYWMPLAMVIVMFLGLFLAIYSTLFH